MTVTVNEEALIQKEAKYFGLAWGIITGPNPDHNYWPAAILARSRGWKLDHESWEHNETTGLDQLALCSHGHDERQAMVGIVNELAVHWGFTDESEYLLCLAEIQQNILNAKARQIWRNEQPHEAHNP